MWLIFSVFFIIISILRMRVFRLFHVTGAVKTLHRCHSIDAWYLIWQRPIRAFGFTFSLTIRDFKVCSYCTGDSATVSNSSAAAASAATTDGAFISSNQIFIVFVVEYEWFFFLASSNGCSDHRTGNLCAFCEAGYQSVSGVVFTQAVV